MKPNKRKLTNKQKFYIQVAQVQYKKALQIPKTDLIRVLQLRAIRIYDWPSSITIDNIISKKLFQIYGSIDKIKYTPHSKTTFDLFVYFNHQRQASLTYLALQNFNLNGQILAPVFGTIKFCKYKSCKNKNCDYAHQCKNANIVINLRDNKTKLQKQQEKQALKIMQRQIDWLIQMHQKQRKIQNKYKLPSIARVLPKLITKNKIDIKKQPINKKNQQIKIITDNQIIIEINQIFQQEKNQNKQIDQFLNKNPQNQKNEIIIKQKQNIQINKVQQQLELIIQQKQIKKVYQEELIIQQKFKVQQKERIIQKQKNKVQYEQLIIQQNQISKVQQRDLYKQQHDVSLKEDQIIKIMEQNLDQKAKWKKLQQDSIQRLKAKLKNPIYQSFNNRNIVNQSYQFNKNKNYKYSFLDQSYKYNCKCQHWSSDSDIDITDEFINDIKL